MNTGELSLKLIGPGIQYPKDYLGPNYKKPAEYWVINMPVEIESMRMKGVGGIWKFDEDRNISDAVSILPIGVLAVWFVWSLSSFGETRFDDTHQARSKL